MEPRKDISTISIDAEAREVWRVLSAEFLDVAAWVPGVNSSGPNPQTPNGINGSLYGGRVCDVEGLGKTDERIVAYDSQARMLSYTVEAENLPPFIEKLQNTLTVTANGTKRCNVDVQMEITITDSMSDNEEANTVVEAMFAAVRAAAAGLKTYIESNRPPQEATMTVTQ